MSSIPTGISRITNLQLSHAALASLNRTNAGLFKVQTQLSTGLQMTRFSDDSVRAAVVSLLDERIERGEQRNRNLRHAESALNVLDAALGEVSELVLEAKGIAATQVNLGSTAQERKGQAAVVNSLIQSLYTLANRQGVAGSIFGASSPGTNPVQAFLGGYRMVSGGDGLVTDTGLFETIPITLGAGNSVGAVSSRIEGSVDLNPGLAADTRLAEVFGARGLGVTLGTIEFSVSGGARIGVDLAGADTAGDIAVAIENALRAYEQSNGVTILGPGGVSFAGESLTIDVAPGNPAPTIAFSDIGNGVTAKDLGLSSTPPIDFSPTSSTGLGIAPKLTWRTPISALAGLTGPLGSIRVNNIAQSRVVDLSTAQTLGDLRNLIEGSGLGLRVEINAAADGINVVNEVSAGAGEAMSIEEIAGQNLTASRLGIRTLSAQTRIADFNDGRGVQLVHGSINAVTGLPDPAADIDFAITLGDGAPTTFNVDLRPQDMATVQTVIDRINAQAAAAGISVPADFQAGVSDGPNGIQFTQTGSYSNAITVAIKANSPAATQLGLAGGSYNASTGTFRAEDRAKVRVDNLFTQLLDLRNALNANDTSGITLAGERLEESVDRLAQSRAVVGSHASRVGSATVRQEDQTVIDQKTRSEMRDLDYSEAAIRLSLLQTQLQAGLQVTALANSRTLLDFLG